MEAITMERVRRLDQIWKKECNAVLQLGNHYLAPSPFFVQEGPIDKDTLEKMAKKWGVGAEDLRTYMVLQRFVNGVFNNDYEYLPPHEYVADAMGIPFTLFNEYVREQVRIARAASELCSPDDLFEAYLDAAREDLGSEEDALLAEAEAAIHGE